MQGPFYLAPMEAVNCASFRVLCAQRGAKVVFTDMIDVDDFAAYGKLHGAQEAIEKYINPQKDEPLAIQVGGRNSEAMRYTLEHIQSLTDWIDLNVGCPLPAMLGKKGGAYMQKHPEQLYPLIKQMRTHITKTFSVKLRAGWDEQSINAAEVAQELERLGVDKITLHPRTRKQLYQDKADWQLARKVKEAIGIPFILSGDVTTTYMAHMAFAHTKCDAVMVARGAKHNPSFFRQLQGWWQKKEQLHKPKMQYEKNAKNAKEDFFDFLLLYKSREKRYRFSEVQDHARWTARGCNNNTYIGKKIAGAKNDEELMSIIEKITFP